MVSISMKDDDLNDKHQRYNRCEVPYNEDRLPIEADMNKEGILLKGRAASKPGVICQRMESRPPPCICHVNSREMHFSEERLRKERQRELPLASTVALAMASPIFPLAGAVEH
jgi:hypothetical protein